MLTGISRRRLDPDEARSHFLPSGAQEAPTGSGYTRRIQSKRKSYKESGRRGRLNGGGATSGAETSSGEEDEESLETRLARLRREAAEVKAAFESKRAGDKAGTQSKTEGYDKGLNELTEVLGSIGSRGAQTEDGAASRLIKRLGTATTTRSVPTDVAEAPNGHSAQADPVYTFSYAPNYEQEHALAKIADFDARLTLLENVLGLDTIALPSQPRSHAQAVLPTLENIDRQLTMISTSTDTKIDSASRRIRQLTQDAQKLTESRKSAKAAQEALSSGGRNMIPRPPSSSQSEADVQSMPSIEDPEQISKINALYGTLPTIEALSPMLPPLLDRLRSLRSVHAEAASAHQGLARTESRQEAMADDLRNWRAGLEKVEEMFEQGQKTMGGNMSAIEGWVKELEERMVKFGK